MKRKFSLLLLIIVYSGLFKLHASTAPAKTWQRCLGGSLLDVPGKIIHSSDGNILLLSNTDSHNGDVLMNHGSTDIWLTKIDLSGNIVWQKSFGGSSIDIGTGLIELPNGRIVITGYTSSTNGDFTVNNGNLDVLMLCLDSQGNKIWTRIYGGSLPDLSYSSKRTIDGGFILGGGSYSNNSTLTSNNGSQDFWVLKTDSNGNLLWQVSAGGNDIDVCYDIAEDLSGNIYACGTTNSTTGNIVPSHGNYDFCVIKFNSSGNVIWNNTYGGSDYETAQTILIDSKNNILIGGYSLSSDGDLNSNFGSGDSWLVQIDCTGALLNQKNYGGSNNDYMYSISESADGSYLFTSGSSSNDYDIKNYLGGEDIWLLKTDSLFNTLWSKNYGGSGNERPVSVIANSDGGFTIAGYTFSNNNDVSGQHGSSDIWVLNLSCSIPNAFFSTSSTICLRDTILLFDASLNATSWNWLINNISISNSQNMQIAFNNTGFQHITLNVQTCDNTSSYETDVNVYDCNLPQVSFTANATSVCAGTDITFNDASINATSWQWSFPGGYPTNSTLQNPVVHYETPGSYSVLLIAVNTYGNQSQFNYNMITVNQLPPKPVIAISGNTLVSSHASNYQWMLNTHPISTAISQTYTATSGGFYSVLITDSKGCNALSDSVYYSMTTLSNPDYENLISIYPNPAMNEINLNSKSSSIEKIQVRDHFGKLVKEFSVDINKKNITINTEDLSSGIYNIILQTEKNEQISKSIIKL